MCLALPSLVIFLLLLLLLLLRFMRPLRLLWPLLFIHTSGTPRFPLSFSSTEPLLALNPRVEVSAIDHLSILSYLLLLFPLGLVLGFLLIQHLALFPTRQHNWKRIWGR